MTKQVDNTDQKSMVPCFALTATLWVSPTRSNRRPQQKLISRNYSRAPCYFILYIEESVSAEIAQAVGATRQITTQKMRDGVLMSKVQVLNEKGIEVL